MDLFFFLIFTILRPFAGADDTAALSLFRSQTDIHGVLTSNWTTADACSAYWIGIECINHRVTAVTLAGINLRGPIDALSSLEQLRFLDLRNNRLNGTISAITQCRNLKLVYLSSNDFSGELPPGIASLHRLLRLDLSNNNLHGPIPVELGKLQRLLTIDLQSNEFSGSIPESLNSLPVLTILDLSNNELSGPIPWSLFFRYGGNSFSGNKALCGVTPFPKCSNQNSFSPNQETENNHKRLRNRAILITILVSSVLVCFLASILVAGCYRIMSNSTAAEETESGKRSSYSDEKRVQVNSGGESDGTEKTKLVFFDRSKIFEVEDLLRASGEMLGKGSLGTVYKAVLDDGDEVAVKRLKDSNPCSRKEFEEYMNVIGKMKHPNLVRFRGFYYARQEKLLIYEFLPNGNLHSLFHGKKGSGKVPLDWTTRISLIYGAARGLATIHEGYSGSRIPHGNVKSSNILLDKNGTARISDFGLALLLSPTRTISRLGGYMAPEQATIKKLSQKADVYSFGIVMLELLTGRDPSRYPSTDSKKQHEDLAGWVRLVVRDEWTSEVFDPELSRYKNIEEEMVSMLHVAMACIVVVPEKRPTMREVMKMIEEIRVEQSPLGEDCDESRSSLSPSLGAVTEESMA